VPTYTFRCGDCGGVTEAVTSMRAMPESVPCDNCASAKTHRIITSSAYHASEAAKTARLDPKYERMVDNAMRSTTNADPDRLLRRMKSFD